MKQQSFATSAGSVVSNDDMVVAVVRLQFELQHERPDSIDLRFVGHYSVDVVVRPGRFGKLEDVQVYRRRLIHSDLAYFRIDAYSRPPTFSAATLHFLLHPKGAAKCIACQAAWKGVHRSQAETL